MSEPDDRELTDRLRQMLDRSTAELDAVTLARLRAARRRALDSPPPRRIWLAAGGISAAALAAGLAAVLWLSPAAAPAPTGLEQLDLLAEADLELVDDIDFYRWLAENERAG